MPQICQYIVVTADEAGALANSCSKYLGQGFLPAGGPFFMPGPVAPAMKLAQAMWRVVELTEEQSAELKQAQSDATRAKLSVV